MYMSPYLTGLAGIFINSQKREQDIKELELKFGSNSPDDLRKLGFTVAVHNDYKMNDTDCTFWLLTKLINNHLIALKGEGISDIIALDIIREQILKL